MLKKRVPADFVTHQMFHSVAPRFEVAHFSAGKGVAEATPSPLSQ